HQHEPRSLEVLAPLISVALVPLAQVLDLALQIPEFHFVHRRSLGAGGGPTGRGHDLLGEGADRGKRGIVTRVCGHRGHPALPREVGLPRRVLHLATGTDLNSTAATRGRTDSAP